MVGFFETHPTLPWGADKPGILWASDGMEIKEHFLGTNKFPI